MEKLGIYVQVPFCQTKCTYCNFHTGVVAKERVRAYLGRRRALRFGGIASG